MIKYSDNQKLYIPLADDDLILAPIQIENGSYTLTNNIDVPRNITILVAVTLTGGFVTVTGFNFVTKKTDTEVLDISVATSLTGTKMFSSIDSVVVTDLVGDAPGDNIQVGTGIITQVSVGKTILNSVIVQNISSGSYEIHNTVIAESDLIAILKAGITPNVYEYNISVAKGIRVINNGDYPLTIIYNQ